MTEEQATELASVVGDPHEQAHRPPADLGDVLAEGTETSETEKISSPRRPREPRRVPVHLEVQTTVLEPTDPACEHCGQLGEKISEEVSEQVDSIPARLIVRRTVRIKRGCQCGCGQIALAPLPPRLLPWSRSSANALASGSLARIIRFIATMFVNSNLATHGAETTPKGLRHFELYDDNTFLFDDLVISSLWMKPTK